MPKPALASDKIIPALKAAKKAGVDVDPALDQLTVLVETASKTATPQARFAGLKSVLTTISDSPIDGHPVIVGWSTCGGCKFHVSRCECPSGPTAPAYIARWVEEYEAKLRGDAGSSAQPETRLPTDVDSPEIAEGLLSPEGVSDSAKSGKSKSARATTGVQTDKCVGCGKEVDATMADVQDDGTMLCFTCQENS